MTLEKPEGNLPEESREKAPGDPGGGKKPVLVYIMVLFIAAFLLMAMSFIAHQRSNTKTIGQLQSSVSAMRDVQDLQKQVIDLQNQLAEAREENETLQKDLEETKELVGAGHMERDMLEFQAKALQELVQILQYYDAGDYEGCYPLLNDLSCGLADNLPKDAPEGLLSPLDQFEAIYHELYDGLMTWFEDHPDGKA